MNENLIAPCGLNCGVSSMYLRRVKGLYKSKNAGCPGCVARDTGCTLNRDCTQLLDKSIRFCNECNEFPCAPIQRLEKRYRTKYHTHIFENLECIKDQGMEAFLREEENKWKCPVCGGMVDMHTSACIDCGKEKTL